MGYQKLYFMLFNAVTDAIRHLEKKDAVRAWEVLLRAQQRAEELFLEEEEEDTPRGEIEKPPKGGFF